MADDDLQDFGVPPSDPAARRCENCGLFAQKYYETQEVVPAQEDYRRTAAIPYRSGGGFSLAPMYSNGICAASRRFFALEDVHPNEEHVEWLRMFRQDMADCDSFVQWIPGLSIKDHKEMLDREFMLKREDARDVEMRRREDERDERMKKREDERDSKLERLQERLHSRELWIIGGLVTGALVVGQIVAAIIEGAVSRGWEPGWWWF
jgi:hypothetical protein